MNPIEQIKLLNASLEFVSALRVGDKKKATKALQDYIEDSDPPHFIAKRIKKNESD